VWHAEQGRFVPLPSQHRPISWAWEHDGSICRDSFLSTEQILFTLHMLLERIMDIARTGSVHTAHAAGEDHGAGAAPALLRQCQPGSMVAESGSQKTRRQRARRQRAGKSGGSRGQETWRQQKPGSMVAAGIEISLSSLLTPATAGAGAASLVEILCGCCTSSSASSGSAAVPAQEAS